MNTDLLKAAVSHPPKQLLLPKGFVDAAVLLPVWEGQLLFTVRSAHLPHHAAQISFPGGRFDPGETAEEAALREAREEVGLNPEHVEILGHLNPTLSPFGYRVFPLLGRITQKPHLIPNPEEVDALLWVPIKELLEAPAYAEERIPPPGNRFPGGLGEEFSQVEGRLTRTVWHYPWRGYDIWGVTGNIVHDFLERIREVRF
ncbi:CoA pyrophosphatase [Meiothermus sp.]|jgi:mutator protein MutT|uniref:NUDIX hydrolase n=1 Tax=Meiothermus sp. TaxID=1955249 RepID=UPI0021DD5661|nr:CoA pyrophosphatase [Meiothermus sp.]GIW26331.1 MAG: coenzyme A pyrophosphatase [Meiothermus sp.]